MRSILTIGPKFRDHLLVPIGENIYRPILDGYREGDDARDVYKDAIDWWETELDGIEGIK